MDHCSLPELVFVYMTFKTSQILQLHLSSVCMHDLEGFTHCP